MLPLKEYQQQTLDAMRSYFKECLRLGNADTAFYEYTRQSFGSGIPYREVKELPGLPYICLRIPTGGGKTLVASHSIEVVSNDLLNSDKSIVLWLVPSNTIREQTLFALKDKNHPYRQALETSFESIRVLSIQESLYVTRSTLNTETTIIVSTMQAFRVDDTEGRKVYEQAGSLMEHFNGIDPTLLKGLECYEDGKPIPSLANVLRLRRPIIIVDEAHNARTLLSFETLARFNPSCIIELTATPDLEKNPSNVLHTVSAAELKADQMIKMPIRLETRANWKELIGDAIRLRDHLEAISKAERQQTGEYIRPIMLIQAQPQSQHHKNLTVEIVEQCLIEDYSIPTEQIRRATGTDKGLEGIDLAAPNCEVRYIITVQALREGWDCPFAYVLCSVAEMRSSTAVEQILGRIMRLPKAKRKNNPDLNMAYAFSASQNFIDAANALEDALVQNGFNRQEAKDFITKMPSGIQGGLEKFWTQVSKKISEQPQLKALPWEIASKIAYDRNEGTLTFTGVMEESEKIALKNCFSTPEGKAAVELIYRKSHGIPIEERKAPSERGEAFSVPVLAVKQGELFEVFEETHFLEIPWELSKCDFRLSEVEYSAKQTDGQIAEIDVSDKGQLTTRFLSNLQYELHQLTYEKTQTISNLANWLDRTIPHPDITPSETAPFLTGLIRHLIEEREFSLEQLFNDKYRLRHTVEATIRNHREQAHKKSYQTLLLPECATPLVVAPDVCFSFDPLEYPYNTRYQGSYQFKKHYYKEVGNLRSDGEEFECAVFIDTLPEVKFWVRNIERRERHSFWLQTSTDKFYPDFVCLLNDGRYLVIEYKGADRWSDDDSKEKRLIGELWGKRSNGRCLFVMPKGKDLEAIIAKI